MWSLARVRSALAPPPLGLPPCPTEETAKLALVQLRRESRVYQSVAAWFFGALFLMALDLTLGRGDEFPGTVMAAVWGALVAWQAHRNLRSRRRRFRAQHRLQVGGLEKESGETVEALRRRLLRSLEEARESLRQADGATLQAMSEGEGQALGLVAWLDRAEPALARHRAESRLRRQVVARLAEPVGPADRVALARLRQHLETNDRRRTALEAREARRRDRVESLILALEGLSHAAPDDPRRAAVSASVRRRVEDLAGRDATTSSSLGAVGRRIREEVRLAQELQRSILPSTAPDIEGLRVAHFSRPSSEVGGDFYDFYRLDATRLLVAIGDASGHGIDSSMVSSMAKSALYTQVSAGHGPSVALAELNRMLCDTLGRRRFMTLALLQVDLTRRGLEWVNAGQLYPLLRRGESVRELPQPSYPLGVRRNQRYQASELALEPGDLLVLVTDGLVEALDDQGELFGFERVHTLLQESQPTASAAIETLVGALETHLGDGPLQDDVTLLALEVQG